MVWRYRPHGDNTLQTVLWPPELVQPLRATNHHDGIWSRHSSRTTLGLFILSVIGGLLFMLLFPLLCLPAVCLSYYFSVFVCLSLSVCLYQSDHDTSLKYLMWSRSLKYYFTCIFIYKLIYVDICNNCSLFTSSLCAILLISRIWLILRCCILI